MAARGEGSDAVVVDNLAANIADLQKKAEAAGDDSGASMSTGEKKLLLRHRDSFMVTKSHHHVPELGGGGGGGGGGGSSRATVAGLYTASGLAEAVRQGSAAAGAAGGAGGEEGGEAHTAYVLDGLEEMGGRGSVAEGAGGGEGGGFASPSAHGRDSSGGGGGSGGSGALSPSSAGSVDESPRRKNRLFSFVKGVASALGLRASKKGKKGGASPEAPGSASAQSPRGGSFAPGGGSEGAGDDPFGEGYEPAQDETGYIPSHRTLPTPRSILKTGPDGSPRAAPGRRDSSDPSSPRGASASSQAEALGDAYGEEGGGASAQGSGRRGLSFADQHGHDLELVKYSERLHYSVASEHVQGEESSRSCSVM
jgi:hypothetical protein